MHPVNIGHNTAEWCEHIVKAFTNLEFSMPVEFWMLDWKNEIRIIPVDDFELFKQELQAQLPDNEVVDTLGGAQIHSYPRGHDLSGWGIVL